jgi:hypothetical protein
MGKNKGPDFNELARISRLNSGGGGGGGDSGGSSSGGGSGSGDESKEFKLGANSDFVQSINNSAQGGVAAALLGVLGIRGLDQTTQSFAIEASVRGGSLQGVASSLYLTKPRAAIQGKNGGRG